MAPACQERSRRCHPNAGHFDRNIAISLIDNCYPPVPGPRFQLLPTEKNLKKIIKSEKICCVPPFLGLGLAATHPPPAP